ncbi:superoxide dismutase family protein [Leptolyngbya sp. FACHB-261]|uniref:superoxide dismutase family protein n=1 Tax=Leptolyngbya sp. FACHB-261 TaxID=2692806 RepID=UPI0016898EE2|nr:superoxide dismutase family protein [Leptolyngbya sp. FACHB-261]MBD2102139.1 superoxide dismutase family protein [Leptolyngbya sp. FACHB-261]
MKLPSFTTILVPVIVLVSLVIGFIVTSVSPPLAADLQAKAQITGPGITGNLALLQGTDGLVRVRVELQGNPQTLTPGLHGLHLHETGSCQAAGQTAFGAAKGHFDPGPFGSSTPVEANHPYHMGDLPNILIDQRGRGRLQTSTNRIALTNGPLSLFDADGSAVIVHKLNDQFKAGGSAAEAGGARLACGVIEKT